MKLGQNQSASSRTRTYGLLAVLAVAFGLGVLIGASSWPRQVQRSVMSGLGRLRLPGSSADLPVLALDIGFSDYSILLAQREQAVEAGVNAASDADFVDADLRVDGASVPVWIRLGEGPAERLGPDDKWTFDVRVDLDVNVGLDADVDTGSGGVLGFRRFHLRDPAAVGWLDQWAFVEALRREDVLTARVAFVRLVLNGADRGIYALQEGLDEPLMISQGRDPRVVVRFDADPLWQALAHYEGDEAAAEADPVTNLSLGEFRTYEIDTFRDAAVARDPLLATQRDQAVALLHALQTGARPASEVLDVDRYARFLALVDLWGATDALLPAHLSFAYDADSGRLEPICLGANGLRTGNRISPAATFDDPLVQMAYVREVRRLVQTGYLADLEAELSSELQRLSGALGAEGAEASSPWEQLRARQALLHRSLDPVRPIVGYLAASSSSYATLRLYVANALNVPVEIVGVDINRATLLPFDSDWVTASPLLIDLREQKRGDGVVLRAQDGGGRAAAPASAYVTLDIPLTAVHRVDAEIDFDRDPDIRVAIRIVGDDELKLVPVQPGLPAPLSEGVSE